MNYSLINLEEISGELAIMENGSTHKDMQLLVTYKSIQQPHGHM